MNSLLHTLRLARQDFFKLRKHREAPAWALWLLTAGVGLAWGIGLLSLFGVLGGRLLSASYWLQQGPPFIATTLVIGFVFHAVYTSIERLAPQSFIDWTNGEPGFLISLFFGVVSIACVACGVALSYLLIGSLPGMERIDWTPQRSWLSFAALSVFASFLWGLWAWQEWHDEQLKRRTKEAELRLLQAQIEPHFLFNTLANVRSLIDFAPKEAGEMLDAFTDHLRASLTGMRADTVPLDQELTLLGHYMRLMKMRMGDRLNFSIEADASARAVMLPPLLLQPLVENAIHHGLEGQVEPGHVRIVARVANDLLQVVVQDDGIGLHAPRTRPGNGLATQNIRERLNRRYGSRGRLHLEPASPKGTRALLELPLNP